MDRARRPLIVRALLAVAGATLLLLGLAGVFLPILPGLPLLAGGLALLAGEFVWARKLLDGAVSRISRSRDDGTSDGEQQAA
jgi:hypothetical protein